MNKVSPKNVRGRDEMQCPDGHEHPNGHGDAARAATCSEVPRIPEALTVHVRHPEIDAIHGELAELAVMLAGAGAGIYPSLFAQLVAHTEAHFAHEEQLMREAGFPHGAEHLAEHRQMLGEMKQFQSRRPSISRAYVAQRLPERFNLHISRMDSLLAAWLNDTGRNLPAGL